MWQLVTYAFVHLPHSLVHLPVVAICLAFPVWFLEPCLGAQRGAFLILGSALAGGIGYTAIESVAPFVGGAFVAVGYWAAFFTWSIRRRQSLPRGLKLTWLLLPFGVLYAIGGTPSTIAANAVASSVGVFFGWRSSRPAA